MNPKVEAHLFKGLPQGRRPGVRIRGIDSASREGKVPGPRVPFVLGPVDQQDLGPIISRSKNDGDGGPSIALQQTRLKPDQPFLQSFDPKFVPGRLDGYGIIASRMKGLTLEETNEGQPHAPQSMPFDGFCGVDRAGRFETARRRHEWRNALLPAPRRPRHDPPDQLSLLIHSAPPRQLLTAQPLAKIPSTGRCARTVEEREGINPSPTMNNVGAGFIPVRAPLNLANA
jgi:hypothetical protein